MFYFPALNYYICPEYTRSIYEIPENYFPHPIYCNLLRSLQTGFYHLLHDGCIHFAGGKNILCRLFSEQVPVSCALFKHVVYREAENLYADKNQSERNDRQ